MTKLFFNKSCLLVGAMVTTLVVPVAANAEAQIFSPVKLRVPTAPAEERALYGLSDTEWRKRAWQYTPEELSFESAASASANTTAETPASQPAIEPEPVVYPFEVVLRPGPMSEQAGRIAVELGYSAGVWHLPSHYIEREKRIGGTSTEDVLNRVAAETSASGWVRIYRNNIVSFEEKR